MEDKSPTELHVNTSPITHTCEQSCISAITFDEPLSSIHHLNDSFQLGPPPQRKMSGTTTTTMVTPNHHHDRQKSNNNHLMPANDNYLMPAEVAKFDEAEQGSKDHDNTNNDTSRAEGTVEQKNVNLVLMDCDEESPYLLSKSRCDIMDSSLLDCTSTLINVSGSVTLSTLAADEMNHSSSENSNHQEQQQQGQQPQPRQYNHHPPQKQQQEPSHLQHPKITSLRGGSTLISPQYQSPIPTVVRDAKEESISSTTKGSLYDRIMQGISSHEKSHGAPTTPNGSGIGTISQKDVHDRISLELESIQQQQQSNNDDGEDDSNDGNFVDIDKMIIDALSLDGDINSGTSCSKDDSSDTVEKECSDDVTVKSTNVVEAKADVIKGERNEDEVSATKESDGDHPKSVVESINVLGDITKERTSQNIIADTNIVDKQEEQNVISNEKVDEDKVVDQWREVDDRKTGRVYYYNRRTRESTWHLPDNAILIRRKRKADKKEDHLPSSSDDKENKENLPPTTNAGVTLQKELLDLSSVSNSSNRFDRDRSVNEVSMSVSDISKAQNEKSFTTMNTSLTIDEQSTIADEERFQRLKDISRSMAKRSFFFPDDSAEEEDDEVVEEAAMEQAAVEQPITKYEVNHEAVDEDWCFESYDDICHTDNTEWNQNDNDVLAWECSDTCLPVFCVYCGARFNSPHEMSHHVRFNCRQFMLLHQERSGANVTMIQNELMNVYNISREAFKNTCTNIHSDDDKENLPPKNDDVKKSEALSNHHPSQNEQKMTEKREVFKPLVTNDECIPVSNEENHVNEISQESSYHEQYTSDFYADTSSNYQTTSHEYDNEDDLPSPIQSSCPFCSKTFSNGNKFSSHLLKCKARRKSTKKRLSMNQKNQHHSFPTYGGVGNPGASVKIQSLLLTERGGRTLPGYPKLSTQI